MQIKYAYLFEESAEINVPRDFVSNILRRIARERVRTARMRTYVYAVGASVSLATCIPAIWFLVREAAQSGFVQYASLVFSDWGTVVTNASTFIFSLLETFPVTGTIAVCVALCALLGSIRGIFGTVRQRIAVS